MQTERFRRAILASDHQEIPVAPRLQIAGTRKGFGARTRRTGLRSAGDSRGFAARSLRESPSQTLWVKSNGVHHRIKVESVAYIQAERDYVRLHVAGQSHLISRSISAMESSLAPLGFLRIHRSTLVCRDAVIRMEQGRHGALVLRLRDGTELRVGRSYAANLRSALIPS
ncbi:LytTR family DNA-binding domain-containing protein [Corticibacterium sp. UT-5YL-CI-8]|nr:LytTR family DNA-binding domain-containing protein [Tianweitania sp. UT-5YL-CI-8]